ncbi:MAG: hypothetical protein KIH67_003315 [Candidatus Moranbacteria bacterium]|nr:hypothetical protein [Candidatus Moranbacteria bacterium]
MLRKMLKNKNRKELKKRKAFSFGEVLMSAFVLTVGLTATTALISSSLQYSFDNRDAVIATQLAQEGIELMRNVRDQNFATQADGGNGGDGFQGFDENQKNCRVNANGMTCFSSQGSPSSQRYYLSAPTNPGAGGRFTDTGSVTRFARYVYVEYNNTDKTARVVSYVFWDWTNGASMPSFVPANGGVGNCTLENKCVFSEIFLTKWGLL